MFTVARSTGKEIEIIVGFTDGLVEYVKRQIYMLKYVPWVSIILSHYAVLQLLGLKKANFDEGDIDIILYSSIFYISYPIHMFLHVFQYFQATVIAALIGKQKLAKMFANVLYSASWSTSRLS